MRQTRWASLAVLWALSVTPAGAQTTGPQTTYHDNWSVSPHNNTGFIAASVNESLQVFGQYCFAGTSKCVWMLSIDRSCTKGDKYPVLINSNVGALSAELLCDEPLERGKQRYIFLNFDEIDQAVRGSSKLAIAMPLQGDTFVVVRFNLIGALEALKTMHIKLFKNKPTGTKDLNL